jgi:lipopolysaccharide transport protein LptA
LNHDRSAPSISATPAEKPAKKEKPNPLGQGTTKSGEPITTQIYADQASFDSAKYIGVFSGHVIVNDPRFNVQADKLTVYMHKAEQDGEEEGLERAIAEGNVGIVRDRPDPNGGPPQRAIGRAEKALYNAKDGTVELSGSPRVQSGMNSHVATSADTVMVMNQDNQLTTRGPSRTELRQEAKPSPSPTPAATASPSKSP